MINRRKDGSLYNEEMTITPVCDERGLVTYFIAMKQDITDRKKAETSLRESEELFRSLSVSSPLGIFLTNAQGQLTYANPRCRELYGFTLMESQNDGWKKFVHADDREWVTQKWQAFIGEGVDYSVEYRVCHRDGKVRYIHVRAARMQSDRGEATGFVGTVEDVTVRKRSGRRSAGKQTAVGACAGRVAGGPTTGHSTRTSASAGHDGQRHCPRFQ